MDLGRFGKKERKKPVERRFALRCGAVEKNGGVSMDREKERLIWDWEEKQL